jgi:hypothetical protein
MAVVPNFQLSSVEYPELDVQFIVVASPDITAVLIGKAVKVDSAPAI